MIYHYRFSTGAIFFVLFALALISCEQIVEVNLLVDEPKIVIESSISNGNGPFTVKLTNSQSYFNQGEFCGIENAVVKISDLHTSENLFEKGSGIYSTVRMRGISGRSYRLDVSTGGKDYTASVVVPPPVSIDTIYFQQGLFSKDSLNAYVQFCDPRNIENYYRIKLFCNGRYATNDYYLISDTFTDGQILLAPLYHRNFAPGDTLVFELCNLERSTWKYYKGISEIMEKGVNLQAPGNPPSNISGGALGNFGAWGKSTYKIIVPRKTVR